MDYKTRRRGVLGNPNKVEGFLNEDLPIKTDTKKEKVFSSTIEESENATFAEELGVISERGFVFKMKLIDQFQLTLQSSSSYKTPAISVKDFLENITKIISTDPDRLIQLPLLSRNRIEKTRISTDDFSRQRNKTKYKHRSMTPLNEWAYWVLSARVYHRLIQITLALSLLSNTLIVEHHDLIDKEVKARRANERPDDRGLATYSTIIHALDYSTTILLLFDIFLKWLYNFSMFWASYWNILDVLVIVTSTPVTYYTIMMAWVLATYDGESKDPTHDHNLAVFIDMGRICRMLLSIRLAFSFEGTRLLMILLKKTLSRLAQAAYLFLLALFTFGMFCIIAFDKGTGENLWFPYNMPIHIGAIVFMFRMYTCDGWYKWYKSFNEEGYVPQWIIITFCVSWIMLSSFLLGNIFVSLLTVNFQEIRMEVYQRMAEIQIQKTAADDITNLNDEMVKHSGESLEDIQILHRISTYLTETDEEHAEARRELAEIREEHAETREEHSETPTEHAETRQLHMIVIEPPSTETNADILANLSAEDQTTRTAEVSGVSINYQDSLEIAQNSAGLRAAPFSPNKSSTSASEDEFQSLESVTPTFINSNRGKERHGGPSSYDDLMSLNEQQLSRDTEVVFPNREPSLENESSIKETPQLEPGSFPTVHFNLVTSSSSHYDDASLNQQKSAQDNLLLSPNRALMEELKPSFNEPRANSRGSNLFFNPHAEDRMFKYPVSTKESWMVNANDFSRIPGITVDFSGGTEILDRSSMRLGLAVDSHYMTKMFRTEYSGGFTKDEADRVKDVREAFRLMSIKHHTAARRWLHTLSYQARSLSHLEETTEFPKDTLFSYLTLMSALNENLHERKELLRLAHQSLLDLLTDQADVARARKIHAPKKAAKLAENLHSTRNIASHYFERRSRRTQI